MFGFCGIGILKNAETTTKTSSVARNIARSIWQKGNGQLRTVISGFTGPNVDLKDLMDTNALLIRHGYRFAVKGFNNANVGTAPHKCGFFQKIKFFPNFNFPNMRRHVVYDLKPQRTIVQGFQTDTSEAAKTTGSVISSCVMLPSNKSLFTNERVVVQGFNINSSSEPAKRAIDLTNSKPRTVIKGFLG